MRNSGRSVCSSNGQSGMMSASEARRWFCSDPRRPRNICISGLRTTCGWRTNSGGSPSASESWWWWWAWLYRRCTHKGDIQPSPRPVPTPAPRTAHPTSGVFNLGMRRHFRGSRFFFFNDPAALLRTPLGGLQRTPDHQAGS